MGETGGEGEIGEAARGGGERKGCGDIFLAGLRTTLVYCVIFHFSTNSCFMTAVVWIYPHSQITTLCLGLIPAQHQSDSGITIWGDICEYRYAPSLVLASQGGQVPALGLDSTSSN